MACVCVENMPKITCYLIYPPPQLPPLPATTNDNIDNNNKTNPTAGRGCTEGPLVRVARFRRYPFRAEKGRVNPILVAAELFGIATLRRPSTAAVLGVVYSIRWPPAQCGWVFASLSLSTPTVPRRQAG